MCVCVYVRAHACVCDATRGVGLVGVMPPRKRVFVMMHKYQEIVLGGQKWYHKVTKKRHKLQFLAVQIEQRIWSELKLCFLIALCVGASQKLKFQSRSCANQHIDWCYEAVAQTGSNLHRVRHVTYHCCPWSHCFRGCGDILHLVDHVAYHRWSWRHGFRGCGAILHLVDHVTYHHCPWRHAHGDMLLGAAVICYIP